MSVLERLKERIDEWRVRLYLWARERADGPHAKGWLFALGFSEASFFLIPPDVLLVTILLLGAQRWWYWAGLTTVSSVLGGIFGYLIGFAFFDIAGEWIINAYHLEEEVRIVSEWYGTNAFWSIFVSALTPIPYKVFTISAGLFHVNILTFIAASLAGRGIRFYGVAYLTHRFGKQVMRLVLKYFNAISIFIIIIALLLIILL